MDSRTGKKLNNKELQSLKDKPYMFKWMTDDRPP